MKNILYTISELSRFRDNFLKELDDSLAGKETSLAFLKNELTNIDKNNITDFQVISLGGTNFEKTMFDASLNSINFNSNENGRMPLIKNKDIFLEFVDSLLRPETNILALNFAYPLSPVSRISGIDGVLIKSTKEHMFEGLINCCVGEEIEKYIFSRHGRKIRVVVANDTVCLVLSGLNADPDPMKIIGGVVGTGLNFGLFLERNIIINLESGNFGGFTQSETGKLVDSNSINRGENICEKEVSGAYLYQHFNLVNKNENKNWINLSSTEQLSDLANSAMGESSELAQKLIERSASLVASKIAGIYLFKKKLLRNKNIELIFVMEGSLFWKGWNYKNFIESYLYKLNIPKNSIKFMDVKNSNLAGAAALVTQN